MFIEENGKKRLILLASVSVGFMISQFTGCSCGDNKTETKAKVATCENRHQADNCADDLVYIKGKCDIDRCDIVDGGNCCPGMVCSNAGECKIPTANIIKCVDSSECPAGMRCMDRPLVSTESKTCAIPSVGSNGLCPDGSQYFAGRCVMTAPCGGSCDVGKVCNLETNSCEAAPYIPEGMPASGCDTACNNGELLVYDDPDSMIFEHCCEIKCHCEQLPPIMAGSYGRFNDVALGEDAVYVSSYDDTYGDLVLSRYSRENGQFIDIKYIDGVPASGTLVGSATGLRNGLAENGPKVGQNTAIALSKGLPAIAYYDVDYHAVKLARLDGSSMWQFSIVDNGQPSADSPAGDAGRFIDLYIGDDDLPQITYMVTRGMLDLDGMTSQFTGLVYAKAKKAYPAGRQDWDFYLVDSKPVPAVACNGDCADGQACVKVDDISVCRSTSTECGNCSGGMTCINDSGVNMCLPTATMPNVSTIVQGVGLYNSIVMYINSGVQKPAIVYYDSIDGSLKVALANVDTENNPAGELLGFATPYQLDGSAASITINNGGTATGDVGRFASASLAADGKLHISYFDADNNQLRHFSGVIDSNGAEGAVDIADTGDRPDGRHYVGADSALVTVASAIPHAAIIYQDSTNLDLVLSVSQGGKWNTRIVSPCGDLCDENSKCVVSENSSARCLPVGSKVSDCSTSCTDNEECIKALDADSSFECRAIKDDISNGFFVKVAYDKLNNKAYATDMEISFDASEHRTNILGVRVLDASNW